MIDISKIIDLTNQKFGKLTVIKKTENPNSKKKRTYWLCICDCGESSIVDTSSLKSGKTNQCWKCAHNATGKARRVDLTGKKYVGEWKGGKYNGLGTLTWLSGQTYVGDFLDNEYE